MDRESSLQLSPTIPGDRASDEFAHVREAIERSRGLLDLRDDWDGEGAAGYTIATWDRATEFILRAAQQALTRLGLRSPEPRLLPGPDGSIDVEWLSHDRRLYINVPPDGHLLSFYGDDRGSNTIEGSTEYDKSSYWLLAWLTQ